MKAMGLCAVLGFLALLAAPLGAQEERDAAEARRRILEKVRERLAAERARILERVEKIIDEELAKEEAAPAEAAPPDAERKVREAERKLRLLEEQRERQEAEVARLKREAQDEPLRKEAAQKGLGDPLEMQAEFDGALEQHEGGKFAEAVLRFKTLYYRAPGSPFAATSAYNAACGLALQGKKEEALDWLETSVRGGFDKIDHLRNDPDLDCLRSEKRYKKLLTDR